MINLLSNYTATSQIQYLPGKLVFQYYIQMISYYTGLLIFCMFVEQRISG